jgi:hypothetical protein
MKVAGVAVQGTGVACQCASRGCGLGAVLSEKEMRHLVSGRVLIHKECPNTDKEDASFVDRQVTEGENFFIILVRK